MQPLHILFLFALVFVLIVLVITTVLLSARDTRMRREKTLQKETEIQRQYYEAELTSREIAIQEKTYQHLALELHDHVGHLLSLASLRLNSEATPTCQAVSREVSSLISTALQSVRRLSAGLNLDSLRCQGLIRALEQELDYIESSCDYSVKLTVRGEVFFLNDATETALLRIAQEAISNTLRHSAASQISIDLDYALSCLTMRIADNGIGFNASENKTQQRCGSGLLNIQRRATLINACTEIKSMEGKGTSITIKIPAYDRSAKTATHHCRID